MNHDKREQNLIGRLHNAENIDPMKRVIDELAELAAEQRKKIQRQEEITIQREQEKALLHYRDALETAINHPSVTYGLGKSSNR